MANKIGLAFLQNLWAKDPDRIRAIIQKHDEEYRLCFIRQLLFAGGLTGRRLKVAFGDSLLNQIVFEEASREIAGDSRIICKPDLDHIQSVIKIHRPVVIITFGIIAKNAVSSFWSGNLIHAPHPAARQPEILRKLQDAAIEFERYVSC